MKVLQWLKIVYRFRRWLSGGFIGLLILIAGNIVLLSHVNINIVDVVIASGLILFGLIMIVICLNNIFINMIKIYSSGSFKKPLNVKEIGDFLYKRKMLTDGPRVVVIGGGTGISTMLRGLKAYTSNIKAIITVTDDGGGSGVLREHLGILPPGDIRNCLLALAETEPMMESLLKYRFEDGMLKGQNFGNLFIAAMSGISGNFTKAVQSMSDVLAVTGMVMPVTDQNIHLLAELEDGFTVHGESRIGNHNSFHKGRIKKVFLNKDNVRPLEQVLEAIREADLIVLGPGSLYTSIIPNLLVEDVAKVIKKSSVPLVYVCNIMTQPGETDGFSALDHIEAIESHTFGKIIDYCIVNTQSVPVELLKKYSEEGSRPVKVEYIRIKRKGIKVIGEELLSEKDGYIRHQPDKLAHAVMNVFRDCRRIKSHF